LRNKGPYTKWPRDVDAHIVAIAILRERLLDHNTFVVAISGEKLDDRLDGFMVDIY